MKKIISALLLIVILSLSGLGLTGALSANEPSIKFSEEKITVEKKDRFEIDIIINTEGYSVGGAGAKFYFDEDYLKIVDFEPTDLFADYPVVDYDNDDGKAKISGVVSGPDDLFEGKAGMATITFEAIRTGKSIVRFEYIPGSTKDTNLAVTTGNGDILRKVNTLTVTTKGNDPDRTPTPSPTKAPTRIPTKRPTSYPTAYPTYVEETPIPTPYPDPSEPEPVITEEVTPVPTSVPGLTITETPGSDNQNNLSKYNIFFIIGGVIVLLILIALGFYFLFFRNTSESEEYQ